ncbi:unnamed protein product [Mycena citricolor]|uniref:MYND-type domain-containing protein n=1 Tax=Mycena citricolor TaxID=2018698 RepID=A0AAD2H226_9AGAR|nr:unnamed protein product [Mycena citricolor]
MAGASVSCGPFAGMAAGLFSDHVHHYWKTGILSRSAIDIDQARFVNPTFCHSISAAPRLMGDRCTLHHLSYPLQSFQLADSFVESEQQLVRVAQSQFAGWCRAFQACDRDKVTVRFMAGDALAFCHTLLEGSTANYAVNGWKSVTMKLDSGDVAFPTVFDVIDTPNVSDHVGLLNLLVAAAPLLRRKSFARLNTELVCLSRDGGNNLPSLLCSDVPTASLLLGLYPSPVDAALAAQSTTLLVEEPVQYVWRITWKPAGCGMVPQFPDANALAAVLFQIYKQMFGDEADLTRSEVHYHRPSFAALLRLAKSRVRADWDAVFGSIFDRLQSDRTLLMGSNNYQELCCQLHLHGIYTVDILRDPLPARDYKRIFKDWREVPPVVCVTLVVPRQNIRHLEERSAGQQLGTPRLQLEIRGASFHNIFSAIQLAFGRVQAQGSGEDRTITIDEDGRGWNGSSSLIVWAILPAFNLVHGETPTRVSLDLHSTPETAIWAGFSGLALFSAVVTSQYLYVTQNRPNQNGPLPLGTVAASYEGSSSVSCNVSDTQIRSMALRWSPNDTIALADAEVQHSQHSSRSVLVTIDDSVSHELEYPYPIDAARLKARIARKSGWIEVEASVRKWEPSPLQLKWRSTLNDCAEFLPRVNCDLSPTADPTRIDCLNRIFAFQHLLMMSPRERRAGNDDEMRKIKSPLAKILSQIDPAKPKHVFGLVTAETQAPETLIIVQTLRLDLGSDSVFADCGILPVTRGLTESPLASKIDALSKLATKVIIDRTTWRHLLVAFTERCRDWFHKPDCLYALAGKAPLSLEAGQNWLCSCGSGVGIYSQDPDLAGLMTRAAIAPIFAVPYWERVTSFAELKALYEAVIRCAACQKSGGALLTCSSCKKVQYCSRDCQKAHWKVHKKQCM